jgi:hypothetical protein
MMIGSALGWSVAFDADIARLRHAKKIEGAMRSAAELVANIDRDTRRKLMSFTGRNVTPKSSSLC